MIVKKNVPLSRLTTYQTHGELSEVYYFQTVSKLADFMLDGVSFFVLGKGSNTLIDPAQRDRRIIQLSPDMFPVRISDGLLRVPAAMPVSQLMSLCQKEGLTGLEFCAGVPASVGGMVAMNFGCWERQFSDIVDRVHVMTETGQCVWLSNHELNFGYRRSLFQEQPFLVLEAEFQLATTSSEAVKALVLTYIRERLAKQPLRQKTFGSIFKNPNGDHAAKLLDVLGLKGSREGDVQLSAQHANFLVNLGTATFGDTMTFLEQIREQVKMDKGVRLDYEVRIVR